MSPIGEEAIRKLLRSTETIAVVGASNRVGRPAYYVPQYLARSGYRILPVNPHHVGQSLWNNPVASTLRELEEPVDIVNVFRRSEDIPGHLDDILAMATPPRAVWFQLGIRNDDAAERLERSGIEVIQDSCILIEHRALN